jgi:hypothetical protein
MQATSALSPAADAQPLACRSLRGLGVLANWAERWLARSAAAASHFHGHDRCSAQATRAPASAYDGRLLTHHHDSGSSRRAPNQELRSVSGAFSVVVVGGADAARRGRRPLGLIVERQHGAIRAPCCCVHLQQRAFSRSAAAGSGRAAVGCRWRRRHPQAHRHTNTNTTSTKAPSTHRLQSSDLSMVRGAQKVDKLTPLLLFSPPRRSRRRRRRRMRR